MYSYFTGTSTISGGLLGVTGKVFNIFFLNLVNPIVLVLEGAVVTDFLTGVDGLLDLPTLIDLCELNDIDNGVDTQSCNSK